MLLPFVIALKFSEAVSDLLVIILSLGLLLFNILVANVEASSIAAVGKKILSTGNPSLSWLLRTYRKNFSTVIIASTIASLSFAIIFAWGRFPILTSMILALGFSTIGWIGSCSGIIAGAFVAIGKTNYSVSTIGLRSIFPLIYLSSIHSPAIYYVPILYIFGEICRVLVLSGIWKLRVNAISIITRVTKFNGINWQIAATTGTQLNPLVDKYFLTFASQGSLIAFELAEKIGFAVFQIAYNLKVLPQLGPLAIKKDISSKNRFLKLLMKTIGFTLVFSFFSMLCLYLVAVYELVPTEWQIGVSWSLFVLASMPMSIGITFSFRYLVIQGMSKWMFGVSYGGLLLNIIFDWLLFSCLGPVGIVVASIPTRAITLFLLVSIIKTRCR